MVRIAGNNSVPVSKLLGQRKRNTFFDTNRLRYFCTGQHAYAVNDPLDQNFRGRSASSDANSLLAFQPAHVNFVWTVDQVAGDTARNRHFLEATGI